MLYTRASGKFYHEYESLNEDRRQALWKARLQSLVDLARERSTFYPSRLDGVDLKATHPLAHVPILESQHLRENVLPGGRGLLTEEGNAFTVFQSGGTTGKPKTTLFTHGELEQINELNARGFYATGLTPEDRVGNLWAVGGLYMTFIHMNRMLQDYGSMNFPFSNHTPADFILNVSNHFKINCFSGIASVVLNVLREIKKTSNTPFKIAKVYYGGEHIYDTDRRELEVDFGVETILAPGYGTVDTWYIGYQCAHSAPGVFHAHEDQCYTEILDEETGQPCEQGKIGILHATPLLRRLTPIIRYKVGDRARWMNESCVCGRTTPLFQLFGRGDDVLRIGYDSIDYDFVQSTALSISELSGSIQMEKKRVEGRDQLVIRIESASPLEVRSTLAERFARLFLEARPSFTEFVKKESIWPLVVEIVDLGTLERNSRTGKLIRTKDVL